MAGFLKGGPRPQSRTSAPPKGAFSFLSKSSSNMPIPARNPNPMMDGGEDGTETTTIIRQPSGEYEVHHADGEVTKHPTTDHMTAHLGARLGGGESDDDMAADSMMEDEEDANARP